MSRMRIACVGGGPAGLSFGILARRQGHEVTVHERLPEGVTYGWGVVFWDDLLHELDEHDPVTATVVRKHAFHWRDHVVDVQGRAPVRIPCHGFSICRHTLLRILADRARDAGVHLHYESPVQDPAELGDVDLVVAGDGVGSCLRKRAQDVFGTEVTWRRNKYIWLGTSRVFDSFTFPFVGTPAGWVWSHCYGYDAASSTFIVEMAPETWRGLRLDQLDTDATMRRLEELFAAQLDGHSLRPPSGAGEAAPWLEFRLVTNRNWNAGIVALMGDAAHTTHFSVGAGTRLALEDAMGLADALREHVDLPAALAAYRERRAAELAAAQQEARNSAAWFENVPRYIDRDAVQFARLMSARRSTLLQHIPPGAYLQLEGLARRAPALNRAGRRAVRGLRGLRRPTPTS
ncbi:FAD-dependent monooxygenase [Nocardioides sp. CER19]|uniref:FAD-dependent monooxygenase n=1 Tax=Nocardioides sp. CER19 TaxID=3038538 RepID=UPI00244B713F|nr:FAD-dependent monooxygenase [Nocardioides sp. CER19]MDH2413849.1 FAD-dependent monooxygenase [Nocardioides sp. CER19]